MGHSPGLPYNTEMTPFTSSPQLRHLILGLLLGGLVALSYVVLHLFLVPVAWAAILVYVTWPIYVRLRQALYGSSSWSALLMVLLIAVAFILPLLWLVVLLRSELVTAQATVTAYLAQGRISGVIARIPWLDAPLQELLTQLKDPVAVRVQIAQWIKLSAGDLLNLLGGVGRNAAKFGFALLTSFFLYRDGAKLLEQVRHVLRRLLGTRVDAYLSAVGCTIKAVVNGLVLTALAQGSLAGLGYWAAGVQAPVLLATLTVVIAMIPFGAPMVWGPISVWLLLTGHFVEGMGLLLWGALVVSWVDNLIRPLVISNATRIPFILVMFGVLGGVAAFGLVGLFLGPVILAVLTAVWREWQGQDATRPANGAGP